MVGWQRGGGGSRVGVTETTRAAPAWPLSRGDQVVGGGDGGGQAGAAATPNSQDGANKDRESKQDDAT